MPGTYLVVVDSFELRTPLMCFGLECVTETGSYAVTCVTSFSRIAPIFSSVYQETDSLVLRSVSCTTAQIVVP